MSDKSKIDRIIGAFFILSVLLAAYIPNVFVLFSSDVSPISLEVANELVNIVVVLTSIYGLIVISSHRNIKVKTFEIITVFVSISSVIISKNVSLIATAVLVFVMIYFENVDLYKTVKVYVIVLAALLLLIVICYIISGNHQYDVVMWRVNHIVNRSALGFNHPNQFMLAWMGFCFATFIVVKENVIKTTLVLLIFSTFLYHFTQSRTEYFLIIAVSFLMVAFHKVLDNEVPVNLKRILQIMPFLLMLISVLLMVSANVSWINDYLSGRPALYKQYYQMVGLKPFGSETIDNVMFDNGYLQMLLSKGWVTFLTYCFVIFNFIKGTRITWRGEIVFFALFVCAIPETILFKFELFIPVLIYVCSITARFNSNAV